MKLLPIFGDPNGSVLSATWRINGETPKPAELIEESDGSMTLWLSPGTHRIELKAKSASGNGLSAEAELDVQVETQVQLRTRPTLGNP